MTRHRHTLANRADNGVKLHHQTDRHKHKVKENHGRAKHRTDLPLTGRHRGDKKDKDKNKEHRGTDESTAADGHQGQTVNDRRQEPRQRQPFMWKRHKIPIIGTYSSISFGLATCPSTGSYPTVTSNMLPPAALEMSMSARPRRATMALVIRSGRDVPMARTVRPMIAPGILKVSPTWIQQRHELANVETGNNLARVRKH